MLIFCDAPRRSCRLRDVSVDVELEAFVSIELPQPSPSFDEAAQCFNTLVDLSFDRELRRPPSVPALPDAPPDAPAPSAARRARPGADSSKANTRQRVYPGLISCDMQRRSSNVLRRVCSAANVSTGRPARDAAGEQPAAELAQLRRVAVAL